MLVRFIIILLLVIIAFMYYRSVKRDKAKQAEIEKLKQSKKAAQNDINKDDPNG